MRRVKLRSGIRGVAPGGVTRRQLAGAAVGVGVIAGATQGGGALAAGALVTPNMQDDAITSLWTEFGTTPTTGKFIDITITRLAGTELIVLLSFGFDFETFNGYLGEYDNENRRRVKWNRGATDLGVFSGIYGPLYRAYKDPSSTDSINYWGGLVHQDLNLDDDEVSGSQNYEFTCDDGVSTSKEVFAYNLLMLERKK